jgi:dUTP pyrophosphatase
MALYIYANNDELHNKLEKQLEKHRWTDSGFDIPMNQCQLESIEKIECFSLGIQVASTLNDDVMPCLLLPRSSIYKTPFRLCNSIGLIDSGYRGEVKAMVDVSITAVYSPFVLEDGARLFQLCRNNFLPWDKIVIVRSLDELPVATDNRGTGGFGSTG